MRHVVSQKSGREEHQIQGGQVEADVLERGRHCRRPEGVIHDRVLACTTLSKLIDHLDHNCVHILSVQVE